SGDVVGHPLPEGLAGADQGIEALSDPVAQPLNSLPDRVDQCRGTVTKVPEEVADPVPEPLAASLVGGAVLFLDVLCQHPGAVPEGIGIGSLPGGRGGRLLELIEDLLQPAGGEFDGVGAAEHLLGVHPPEAHRAASSPEASGPAASDPAASDPAASGPAASAPEASGRAAP